MRRFAPWILLPLLPLLAAGGEGDFLADHFANPIAGAPGPHWGPLESTLKPADCGACHPAQLHDWGGSRHSLAMSPGLQMQLIDNPLANDMCNTCHAPLSEQRPVVASAEAFRSDLQASGLSCPACHVRDGVVHGPPAREQAQAAPSAAPHGGFEPHDAFEDSAFCGTCHQFGEGGFRIEGVLLENTLQEWKASPQGQRGEYCQSCHMPDRRHLWRGIHDPEMTEGGLDIELIEVSRRKFRYSVTNSGIGHSFPTYVTPRVSLILEGLSSDGEALVREGTIIQRRIDVYLQEQQYDTRLAPLETATVEISWRSRLPVVRVVGRLLVEPDEFYFRFFQVYRAASPESQALHALALEEAGTSPYVIGERTWPSPSRSDSGIAIPQE